MFFVFNPGDDEDEDDSESEEIRSLERLLGSRLAEFLDADYGYTLSQVSSSIRPHLYKGPAHSSTTGTTGGPPGKLSKEGIEDIMCESAIVHSADRVALFA